MQTTHAESAVLCYVITNLPHGAPRAIRYDGMPDFDVSATETDAAIDNLCRRGVLCKRGPYYALTDAGLAQLQPDIDDLQSLTA